MARARNIKPAFFKNEDLAELPAETRLLFIGLWTLADREGRLEDRPKRIKMELFAYDSFDVDAMLNELQTNKFLRRYEVDGSRYIYILNFVKHQDPHYREKASEIPPPYGLTDCIVAKNVTRVQRQRIYERDGFRCKKCGSDEHLSIDHIVPIAKGGDSSDGNLQVLCYPCNHRKGVNIEATLSQPSINDEGSSRGASLSPVPLNPDSLNPDSRSLIPDPGIPSRSNDSVARGTAAGMLCLALRDEGVDVTSQNPLLLQWLANGVTVDDGREAVERARIHKPKPERIPAKYLDKVLADIVAEKAGAGPITIVGTRVAQPSQDAIGIAALQQLKESFS